MATKVIEESFTLTRSESGISEADISVATGEGLQDIWTYQIPTGVSLVFKAEDTFSAYLEDSQPAEADAGSLIDIVIKDSSKQAAKSLLNQLRYAQIKEFQDVDKLVHLDIPTGEEVVVKEGEFVIIRGNILTQTLDASDSYFQLTGNRIRHTLFE